MDEPKLAALINKMTFQISRLTEIAEAQAARQQGLTDEIKHLRLQAAGLIQQVKQIRAGMYHTNHAPSAWAHGEQRDVVSRHAGQQSDSVGTEWAADSDRA